MLGNELYMIKRQRPFLGLIIYSVSISTDLKDKTMIEIIAQLKYDTQNIESKINSIKSTREKMKQWVGKPIYKGCEDSILRWNTEILEHKQMIDEYYKKLSLLNETDMQY